MSGPGCRVTQNSQCLILWLVQCEFNHNASYAHTHAYCAILHTSTAAFTCYLKIFPYTYIMAGTEIQYYVLNCYVVQVLYTSDDSSVLPYYFHRF